MLAAMLHRECTQSVASTEFQMTFVHLYIGDGQLINIGLDSTFNINTKSPKRFLASICARPNPKLVGFLNP